MAPFLLMCMYHLLAIFEKIEIALNNSSSQYNDGKEFSYILKSNTNIHSKFSSTVVTQGEFLLWVVRKQLPENLK